MNSKHTCFSIHKHRLKLCILLPVSNTFIFLSCGFAEVRGYEMDVIRPVFFHTCMATWCQCGKGHLIVIG